MNQKPQQQGLTKIDTIRGLLEKMRPEIQKVLPKHLDPARIIRMALTDFQTVKHLNECTQESFLGALMECSQLGLEPGRVLGEAYLLPFRNKQGQYVCKLIPGYRGLITIARRSGEIKSIYARAVFSNDAFDYCYGLEENLTHKPAMGQRGELTYVYAVAKLVSGETQFEVMDAEEIERIRLRSKSSDDGPWITDPIEMSKKSVLKRLCKNLPASVELRTSLAMDVHEDEIQQEPLVEDDWGVLPSTQEVKTFPKKSYTTKILRSEQEQTQMENNNLLDARIRVKESYKAVPNYTEEILKKASLVERDGGLFWLDYYQVGICEDLQWLLSTAEKLEKMVEG